MGSLSNHKVLRFTSVVCFGLAFLLLILFATNPPEVREPLLIYIAFFVFGGIVYSITDFKTKAIGIDIRGGPLVRSIIYGVLAGGSFYLLTLVIPGASIGLPLLPGAISDRLRFYLIVLIAPIAEEIIFRGGLIAYLRSIGNKKSLVIPILISASLFAFAHLGAYVTGIYNYPSFVEGFSAFKANIASFAAAFAFGSLAGYFVTRDGIKNLLFAIIFHMAINLIVFTKLTVIF